MRCEVCGQEIFSKPYKVMIEGARLTVCGKCARHGEIVHERPQQDIVGTRPKIAHAKSHPVKTSRKQRGSKQTVESPLELVEDFAGRIRRAREELKLSHEDLGRRINEKVSVLRKIETGKMTPNNSLAARLEHILKIKLFASASEEKTAHTNVPKATVTEITLGDLVGFGEETAGEKK